MVLLLTEVHKAKACWRLDGFWGALRKGTNASGCEPIGHLDETSLCSIGVVGPSVFMGDGHARRSMEAFTL